MKKLRQLVFLITLCIGANRALSQNLFTISKLSKKDILINGWIFQAGDDKEWARSDFDNDVPESIKNKHMQPFFTTKPTGESTGLGLSLKYDTLMKAHEGIVGVNSVEGEDPEFIIQLPVH